MTATTATPPTLLISAPAHDDNSDGASDTFLLHAPLVPSSSASSDSDHNIDLVAMLDSAMFSAPAASLDRCTTATTAPLVAADEIDTLLTLMTNDVLMQSSTTLLHNTMNPYVAANHLQYPTPDTIPSAPSASLLLSQPPSPFAVSSPFSQLGLPTDHHSSSIWASPTPSSASSYVSASEFTSTAANGGSIDLYDMWTMDALVSDINTTSTSPPSSPSASPSISAAPATPPSASRPSSTTTSPSISNNRRRPSKPHPCPYPGCETRVPFSRRYNLTAHIRAAHTGERPFQCRECDASFARSHDLQRHCRSLHESDQDRRYQCDRCHIRFARTDARKKHMQTCGITRHQSI